MNDWLAALRTALAAGTPAVLVTVASVDGSGPREAGAKMLVTRDAAFDTIGGGHLELRACEIARQMLTADGGRRLERFALGPSLGQCCGGVVQLAFEHIDAVQRGHVELLAGRRQRREDSWRVVALDADLAPALTDAGGAVLAGTLPVPLAGFDRACGCHLLRDPGGGRWLVDPCLAWRAQLLLFGAGHVGAAIVRALTELPCHVTWIDEREELFPDAVPANVTLEATDTPEALAAAAPAGASYLVMTHSHALDQRLAEAILKREDAGWFGLIGSKTKRMHFEHRLRERGVAPERLARMVCPIGLPGIAGKAPAVIAASVCAQLLQVWEQEAKQPRALALSNQGARRIGNPVGL
ncbi:MAG TPA: xanthine dehydrogenase accessory protein XdhC [Noviherbaspirillum sp.]|uniref:xanthine dehydrogenase accessory protein XdhC n=1 Tax=Noviherbaspirillum sp. TaxID=1926288 RepID=UPI002D6239A4|nr:xanthine dehydrogenase accessory protein XdhC [Noviherbaspirillum sp.]HYD93844.1 xanthine dehydrogenase accessory protein XdhC [Noviherbaspirillum sp.]